MKHGKSIKIHDGSFEATDSGQTYSVDKNLTIIASGTDSKNGSFGAIFEDPNTGLAHDNTYNIDGRVVGYGFGVDLFGSFDRVNIGATGEVSGAYGVLVEGDHSIITNRGHATGSSPSGGAGLFGEGMDLKIFNFGMATGYEGIATRFTSGNTSIVNEATGEIFGTGYGVNFENSSGKFTNHGLVHVAEGLYAFSGNSGTDIVFNDGRIEGNINLSDGNDFINTLGGRIHGTVYGGTGDDILVTDNASTLLVEDPDGGADTVRSSVSYRLSDNVETLVLIGKRDINGAGTEGNDDIFGNSGDNTLAGGLGLDTVAGGKGDDVLFGGNVGAMQVDGADTFVFSTGGGHDKVMDYIEFGDILDFSGWDGIDSLDDVISHAHDTADGVVIKLGHDSVLLATYDKTDLSDTGMAFRF